MTDEEQKQITNRHIGKFLARLDELEKKLPQMVYDDVKRAFWFLSNDIKEVCSKEKVNEYIQKSKV